MQTVQDFNENQLKKLEDGKIKIHTILATADRDRINIAYAVYIIITGYDEAIEPALFEYYCCTRGTIESSEQKSVPKEITDDKLALLKSHYQDVVDGWLQSLLNRGLDEKSFYIKLWEFIHNSDIFENTEEYGGDEARAFALYDVIIDRRIPYFKLSDGLRMSNEDYSENQNKILHSIQKLRFILAMDFDQRTEKASHIVRLLDEYDDSIILKSVLVSHIISNYEKREENLRGLIGKRG